MANEKMIQHWNERSGSRWVQMQPRLEAQISPLAKTLLDEVKPGDTVLDVGCGGAQTTLELAERVGPEGRVVGIDVWRAMLAHAGEKARERGADNVQFMAADAQTVVLPEQAFSRVFSRLGVMFFDDPPAAFANIRRAMQPGARLGFVCWQGVEKNAWMRVPMQALAGSVDMPPLPAPGTPGPFSLGERDRLHDVLSEAGFTDIDIESQELPLTIGGVPGLDRAVEFTQSIGMIAALLSKADPAAGSRVTAALREAYAPHDTKEGVKLASASWLVRAAAS